MIEATDTADMTLPAASQLATEAIDPTEPMLPTESTEPMLPMDRIDPLEPMERIDEVDLTDRYERPDSASQRDDGLMHILGVLRVGEERQ